jgi:hypothetical protein
MHFLRIYNEPNLNSWGEADESKLAQEVYVEAFDTRRGQPSLYAAECPEEELRAAAAFALTPGSIKPKNFFIIRLFLRDLREFDLQVDDDGLGGTGIVSVDFRHYEIRNLTAQKAIALTARILNAAREGEDRFRYIATWLQRPEQETFLSLPDEQVIAEAKRRCRQRVGFAVPSDSIKRSYGQICNDLDTNKPAVPLFRIKRAAFLNYCGRVSNGILGSAESDWNNAEVRLRQAYKDAFR